jgi:hypothetical protein
MQEHGTCLSTGPRLQNCVCPDCIGTRRTYNRGAVPVSPAACPTAIQPDIWIAPSPEHPALRDYGTIVFRLNRTPLKKPTPGGGEPIEPVRSATRVTRSVTSITPMHPSRVT